MENYEPVELHFPSFGTIPLSFAKAHSRNKAAGREIDCAYLPTTVVPRAQVEHETGGNAERKGRPVADNFRHFAQRSRVIPGILARPRKRKQAAISRVYQCGGECFREIETKINSCTTLVPRLSVLLRKDLSFVASNCCISTSTLKSCLI